MGICVITCVQLLVVLDPIGVPQGEDQVREPQVDPEAELVVSEILGQGHVGSTPIGCLPSLVSVPSRVKVTGEFLPHVGAADAIVVNPVGDPIDCDLHFGDVGVEIAFRVPGARIVGVSEQQEDALE